MTSISKNFLQQCHMAYPIIQAPMAGGAATPELIACVSNLGGLGSLGAGYMQPEDIAKSILDIHRLTKKAYSANVFVVNTPYVSPDDILETCSIIEDCAKSLAIRIPTPAPPFLPDMEKQVETLLAFKTPIISFTFGIPEKNILHECIKQKRIIIGTATNLEEAQAWQDQECHAIVLQGSEAGGHRGTFLTDPLKSLHPTKALFETCLKKIKLPLIVSGGITQSSQIEYFINQGAAAVQMGTAFLCTVEAGISEIYKKTLHHQTSDNTTLTCAFSGRYARGISNAFITCMEKHSDKILPFPIQNKITKPLRVRASELENIDYMSLWAGQSVTDVQYQTTEELFRSLIKNL
jgi:nitronate monooxygenase